MKQIMEVEDNRQRQATGGRQNERCGNMDSLTGGWVECDTGGLSQDPRSSQQMAREVALAPPTELGYGTDSRRTARKHRHDSSGQRSRTND